jgi:hypothetical protein
MTSLNDTLVQLALFHESLVEFDDALRVSIGSLATHHATIETQWRDDAASAYRQVYEPLSEVTRRYLALEAPRFEQFIAEKLRQLDTYLHGY